MKGRARQDRTYIHCEVPCGPSCLAHHPNTPNAKCYWLDSTHPESPISLDLVRVPSDTSISSHTNRADVAQNVWARPNSVDPSGRDLPLSASQNDMRRDVMLLFSFACTYRPFCLIPQTLLTEIRVFFQHATRDEIATVPFGRGGGLPHPVDDVHHVALHAHCVNTSSLLINDSALIVMGVCICDTGRYSVPCSQYLGFH